jgi:hypothetical protein
MFLPIKKDNNISSCIYLQSHPLDTLLLVHSSEAQTKKKEPITEVAQQQEAYHLLNKAVIRFPLEISGGFSLEMTGDFKKTRQKCVK